MPAFDTHPSEYQVHVRYESLTSESHGRVTEEVLENECMRYGEIVDIVIKRHSEVILFIYMLCPFHYDCFVDFFCRH